MPQVMKPQPVEARANPQFVPAPVDVARLDRCADGGSEHEPVLTPRLAERQALGGLPLAVLAQMTDRQPGQHDRPPGCARLGLQDLQLAVGAL